MQFTDRDKQVIKAVCDFRVLRQDQLQALFFVSKNTCQRGLARLYYHGYLVRHFLPVTAGSAKALYVLDRKGMELLRNEFGYDDSHWFPTSRDLKYEFLEHTSAINDFRIAVGQASEKAGYSVNTWINESAMKADYDWVEIDSTDGTQRIAVIPDSFFALDTPRGRLNCFLELDRGTMSTKRFQTKIKAYLAYRQSGAFQKRYGAKNMRVLTVVLGEKRLAHLKQMTEEVGGASWCWFGVLSDLTAEQVLSATVWQKAGQDALFSLIDPA